MGDVAALKKDDTQFGDGEEGGGEGQYWCEGCGCASFSLHWFIGFQVVVCVDCGKPQEGIAWMTEEAE